MVYKRTELLHSVFPITLEGYADMMVDRDNCDTTAHRMGTWLSAFRKEPALMAL
jgi:hypothetical protein